MLDTHYQKMPCPVPECDGEISFNTYKLLEGNEFVCPQCDGAIGLAPESREKVKKTMGKFEHMREKLLEKKNKHQENN